MRTPDFWSEPGPLGNLVSNLLTPVGAVLDIAGRLRRAAVRPYRVSLPVICVGNLVAGGSGKTPVVLSLAAILVRRAVDVHIVMRGYGGSLGGPTRVDPAVHDAAAVGDEALLTAAQAPCWIARDRAAGVRAAAAAGAAAVLLDDGFQNPSVAKDLSLLVVDADYGFGNCRLVPAGPLRERIAAGMARADAVVLIGEGDTGAVVPGCAGLPVLRAALVAVDGERFARRRMVAFAGIGRPRKFFATLRACGALIAAERRFTDHHRYRSAELAGLRAEAERLDATLVTTAKDFARLPPHQRAGIDVLAVELRWRDEDAIEDLLLSRLADFADADRRIRA